MNKSKHLLPFFVLLFFLNASHSRAQSIQKEKQPLTAILKILEESYNVSFSYADKTIEDKTATLPPKELPLEEVLRLLKKETKLDFELLNNRFIVIKPIKKKRTSFRVQKLEEVVINNYLTTGLTKLNDGSVTIKPESFGILPGLIEPDVLQTIQFLPGVLSTDETVSNINVRGGTHDQNLLLWDGIKMYQSGHFFGLISAFNPYITKKVNVYKNGTSAIYGDGISSIIDMQLPDEIDNEFKGGIGLNFINADGFVKIPISDNTQLHLSSRRSITDVVESATYEQYFNRVFGDSDFSNRGRNSLSQNESFYFYDITAKLLVDLTEKDKLRLNFLNINNKFDYDEQSRINNRTEVLNSKLSQQNISVGLTYQRDWNSQLSTSIQAYASNYDLDATNHDILNNQRLIQENRVNDRAIKLNINYKHNQRLSFISGYQFNEVGISNLEDVNNPLFRSFIKEVLETHALYGETSVLSYDAKTKLKLGARLNYIDKFNKFIFEPRLRFSQRFLNGFRFEVLGEFKSQVTSQRIDLQNDFLGIEKRRWILSNNLVEETQINNQTVYPVPILKSKQVSAGIHYNKNKLLVSAESYIKKVDGITARSQGFQNQFQFSNSIGSYEIKGIDLLCNKQFDDIFSTWVSYSISNNNYMFPDLNDGKKFRNNVDIRHVLSFGGNYTYNNLKLGAGLNWNSGRPKTLPIRIEVDDIGQQSIIYQNPNAANLSKYFRVDCSATYTLDVSRTSRAVLGASVWNILNRKNIINEYYTIIDDEITSVKNESLGITPNVSLRFHF
ncbi:FecR domain-containing protein [Seonamhaeicola sp. ML3]|uniref:FecR domain-containing protein n=1 Tax=Seonamhaeicola sp. ML3 TaxID=2937786 RepID=UPI00200E7443|nr:FecR domain-containing protein [Seonamhaeicola sp. ML3]